MEFKCPMCGNTSLLFYEKMEKMIEMTLTDKHLVCGDIITDEDEKVVRCGTGCRFSLNDGTHVDSHKTLMIFLKEVKEQEEKVNDNPFSLYYANESGDIDDIDKDTIKAKEVSDFLITLLNKMVKDLEALEAFTDYDSILIPVADKIKVLEYAGVGVGDTATDELIACYIEEPLREFWDEKDVCLISDNFYNLIHR